METWSALQIVQQAMGELGLPQPSALPATDVQTSQFLAMLNSAGNELLLYYPWEQFVKTWEFYTWPNQSEYPLPGDLAYTVDQTQWDRTNRWPLMGPKSPQEWAWLKGSLLATLPRIRYRIINDKLSIMPTPGATSSHIALEYISKNWVQKTDQTFVSRVEVGTDVVLYNPWLVCKFIKLKFYELKGFDTTGVNADFLRIFTSLTGKDRGAPRLNLAPTQLPLLIGPWSIPDGNW